MAGVDSALAPNRRLFFFVIRSARVHQVLAGIVQVLAGIIQAHPLKPTNGPSHLPEVALPAWLSPAFTKYSPAGGFLANRSSVPGTRDEHMNTRGRAAEEHEARGQPDRRAKESGALWVSLDVHLRDLSAACEKVQYETGTAAGKSP